MISNRGKTLQSSRGVSQFILSLFLSALTISVLTTLALADGTRTWEQSKFDDLTKGTATGIAIRSSGGLELAPSFKLLYATPSTYIWAVASDDAGNAYAATGSPARVYRITPDGEATIIFEPQELQVQTLEVGPGGVIYAATAPDGKVYKLERKAKGKGETPKAGSKSDKDKEKDAPKDPAKPTLDSPGLPPSISLLAPSTSGISFSTKPATCTLPPEITARFTKLRPKASIPSSSRVTTRTSACSRSTGRGTSLPAPTAAD